MIKTTIPKIKNERLKKKILDLLRYSTSSEGLYKVNSIYVIKSFLDENKI